MTVLKETGMHSILKFTLLKWVGHVIKMSDLRWPKRIVNVELHYKYKYTITVVS